ncbi:hypothetical protein AJ80_04689 [Polytolypa hystricis UAMH7299]|uniref:Fucose-specific lectin n=1 Tax=Polytolypa hystricis (strain UAMH7299) TaxID=1447883 RepID=A0A2B7Y9D8_POLH7|nr:hypothetical protein AJ80_04689 [Polytolypa hystricis UAMH7299]
MSQFKNITRWLLAAGGSTSADGKSTYYLYEEKNTLCIKPWTGSEFAGKSWVATGVKSGTSAPCISVNGKHLVFCVNQSDILKCYAESQKVPAADMGDDDDDDDDDEDDDTLWNDVPSGPAGNIKVHSKSQLEVNISESGITVFYQTPDGRLGTIVNRGKDWQTIGLQSPNVLLGTPLASFTSKEKPLLFYLNDDNSIHFLTNDTHQDTWTDAPLANVKLGGYVSRLAVSEGDDNAGLAAYCLADGKLLMVKESGDQVDVLGTVEKGEFHAAQGQESVLVGWQWRPVPIYMDYVPYYWSPW